MFDRNDFSRDFDKRFQKAQEEFDRDWNTARRYSKIAACITTLFFVLLFVFLIAGIFWFVGNA